MAAFPIIDSSLKSDPEPLQTECFCMVDIVVVTGAFKHTNYGQSH